MKLNYSVRRNAIARYLQKKSLDIQCSFDCVSVNFVAMTEWTTHELTKLTDFCQKFQSV